ncbi:MAG TPA: hypothetical protein VMW15_05105 [Terracidiphilus sp.]|nr:hypothetical protein [Terracidiphilus sp.]
MKKTQVSQRALRLLIFSIRICSPGLDIGGPGYGLALGDAALACGEAANQSLILQLWEPAGYGIAVNTAKKGELSRCNRHRTSFEFFEYQPFLRIRQPSFLHMFRREM